MLLEGMTDTQIDCIILPFLRNQAKIKKKIVTAISATAKNISQIILPYVILNVSSYGVCQFLLRLFHCPFALSLLHITCCF